MSIEFSEKDGEHEGEKIKLIKLWINKPRLVDHDEGWENPPSAIVSEADVNAFVRAWIAQKAGVSNDPRLRRQFEEGDRVMQRDFSGVVHEGMGGVVQRAWRDEEDKIWRYYVAWDVGHAGTCTSKILVAEE